MNKKNWISVKDKMPRLEHSVLVFLKPFGVISFAWREKSQTTGYYERWITMGDVIYDDTHVSHWMELPEKPEENEKDIVS